MARLPRRSVDPAGECSAETSPAAKTKINEPAAIETADCRSHENHPSHGSKTST
jgi:hypothetical protein